VDVGRGGFCGVLERVGEGLVAGEGEGRLVVGSLSGRVELVVGSLKGEDVLGRRLVSAAGFGFSGVLKGDLKGWERVWVAVSMRRRLEGWIGDMMIVVAQQLFGATFSWEYMLPLRWELIPWGYLEVKRLKWFSGRAAASDVVSGL
jgi:hypothetical protein